MFNRRRRLRLMRTTTELAQQHAQERALQDLIDEADAAAEIPRDETRSDPRP